MTPLAVKLQPGGKTFGIFPLDKEEPGETRIFLGYKFPHAGLVHQITTVAVREIPLVLVIGILRVHFPEENGFELVRPCWVQVGGLQGRPIREAGPVEPTVVFNLVATDKQAKVGHSQLVDGIRAEQRSVKQRCDAGDECAVLGTFQLAPLPFPFDGAG